MESKVKNIATIRVKTDIERPIDVDLVAEHIKAVSEHFERAMKAGLKKRAIALLIKDVIPGNFSLGDIMTVLDYAPLIKNHLSK